MTVTIELEGDTAVAMAEIMIDYAQANPDDETGQQCLTVAAALLEGASDEWPVPAVEEAR